tara:strand:- start:1686 stop:2207 length:522 start_codon:yes stop_codon:yes gene_type:complete
VGSSPSGRTKVSFVKNINQPSHEDWMQKAIKLAETAMREDEVPVGAIVIYQGKIIGQGYNQCNSLNDSTAHAEMLAITSASNTIGDWRLKDCTMYVTKEPCSMCAGAIINSRIEFLYFGCYDEDFGACGSKFDICGNVSINTPSVVRGNLLSGNSLALIQEYFFKKRNKKNTR